MYAILNTQNLHFYIGSTKNFRKRWFGHKGKLIPGNHYNVRLQRAWNKYGKAAFQFWVIEVYDAATFFNVREVLKRCRKENPDKVISAVHGGGPIPERVPL